MDKLIGNKPNQVPTNADLGTMAYQDVESYQSVHVSSGVWTGSSDGNVFIDLPTSSYEYFDVYASVTGTSTSVGRGVLYVTVWDGSTQISVEYTSRKTNKSGVSTVASGSSTQWVMVDDFIDMNQNIATWWRIQSSGHRPGILMECNYTEGAVGSTRTQINMHNPGSTVATNSAIGFNVDNAAGATGNIFITEMRYHVIGYKQV